MFENDSIHAFQRSTPRRTKEPKMSDPAKQIKDDFIMDTNNSSIVSKRSVEKLYHAGEPEYFRYFVGKFKRRSPLINRGYWLRMRAIEHTVQRFLEEPTGKRKVVINLGCGYDPLPWLFLGKMPALCKDAVFVDVDYPQLMHKKYLMIQQTEQLKELLPGFAKTGKDSGVVAYSTNYAAIGCDLRNLDLLKIVLQDHLQVEDCSVAVLFVAEVSVAYMTRDASQAVLEWAADYPDVRFCLLEQHLPDGRDHPFAQTMLNHFDKLRTPLHAIGTIPEMRDRFLEAGWPASGIDIRPLWELWSDPGFLSAEQRRALDKVEPFDEWEEFALFASHYFLMVARKSAPNLGPATAPSIKHAELNISTHASGGQTVETLAEIKLPGNQSSRRFSALLPPVDSTETTALHAGLGTKERLNTAVTFTCNEYPSPLQGPPLRAGLMCHSITQLGDTNDCLLVGGRTSPDKASADCWLRRNGVWNKTAPLPEGRYRHSAVSVRCDNDDCAVFLLGGKTSDGRVLSGPMLWTEQEGWRQMEVEPTSLLPAARFGASAVVTASAQDGYWVGGMADDGTIIEDWWKWTITIDGKLAYTDVTELMKMAFGERIQYMFRFGAQISLSTTNQLLVGGVIGQAMLTERSEIMSLDPKRRYRIEHTDDTRPFLIGHCVFGSLVIGGGATCFSFGTHWSADYYLRHENDTEVPSWRLLEHATTLATEATLSSRHTVPAPTQDASAPTTVTISRQVVSDAAAFRSVLAAGTPIVITGADIGPCVDNWTSDYLKDRIGSDRQIVVHASPSSKMDFQTKNFKYETQAFGDFLDAVSQGGRLYLRALSANAPSEKPTDLSKDFPELAQDFRLPPELAHVAENAHSSPLRISGPVTMWLHYDVMANILCQVRGRKRLLLYPPSDVSYLEFAPGASSSSIDVFTATVAEHPSLAHTHPHEVLLEPSECLFIPPLWLHTAAPTEGVSVAVNVFFRNLEKGYAAGRDVYGNRDVAAYEKGRKDVAKIVKTFDELPEDMRKFYLERLGDELLELARK